MTGKKAVVIESRGGFYSEGPARRWTARSRISAPCSASWASTDVTFVRAEKLAFGPEAAEAAIAEASEALGMFAGEALKLAA